MGIWRARLLNLVSHAKKNASRLICLSSMRFNAKKKTLKSDQEKAKEKGRTSTVMLRFNVIHGLSDGRVEEPPSNTDRASLQKALKLVRIGNIETLSFPEGLYKCNFFAFMFTCRSVRYIPSRYVSSHNHTTMDNQRMS